MSVPPTLPLATAPLTVARRVLRFEAAALIDVADRLGAEFDAAFEIIRNCTGRLCLTGVGKSLDVAGKIAGTLNSTGTRTYLLDPTKALHGDLGMIHPDDAVFALSHSGESEELIRLLGPFRELAASLIALTGAPDSMLARAADIAIVYGPIDEIGPLALAPSTSTTIMLALGDALATALAEGKQFSHEDFARFHPAGSLGLKLARVEALMRTGDDVRLADVNHSVREVFVSGRHVGRRTGAVMLVDDAGRLCGLFTDSDLARLFERRCDDALDRPVGEVMTRQPLTVSVGSRVGVALDIMRARKISELPVVDGGHRPVGLLDITDLIGVAENAGVTQSHRPRHPQRNMARVAS